jgi:hypothetical protein
MYTGWWYASLNISVDSEHAFTFSLLAAALAGPSLSTIKTLVVPLRGTTHQLGSLCSQAKQLGIA